MEYASSLEKRQEPGHYLRMKRMPVCYAKGKGMGHGWPGELSRHEKSPLLRRNQALPTKTS